MCRWGAINSYHIAPEKKSIKDITKKAYKNLAQEKVAGLAKMSKFHDLVREAIKAKKIDGKKGKPGQPTVNGATHFHHSRRLCRSGVSVSSVKRVAAARITLAIAALFVPRWLTRSRRASRRSLSSCC